MLFRSCSWKVPYGGGQRELIDADSSAVFRSPDGNNLCYVKIREGVTKISVKLVGNPPKGVLEGPSRNLAFWRWLTDGKSIVVLQNDELWTIASESGKLERYPWNTSDAIAFSDLSPEGTHSLFVKTRMNAKLILIDNFH